MILDINMLRQQAWRAEKLYADLRAYAKSIGCMVVQDTITANETQDRLLARWWQAKNNGEW